MNNKRNYSNIILKDKNYHDSLIKNGYFIAPTLNKKELNQIQEVYSKFHEMVDDEEFKFFMPSVAFKNTQAIEYSRIEIDKIFNLAFNRIFTSEKVAYTGGVFLIKKAGKDTHHDLHQDRALVDEKSTYGLYSWTPITKTNHTTGKMFVIPKSNYLGSPQRSPQVSFKQLNEKDFSKNIIELDIALGETLFFDTALMHGSLPNTSGKDRVAVNFFVKPQATKYTHFEDHPSDERLINVFEIDPNFFFQKEHLKTNKNVFMKFLRSEKKQQL